MKLSRMVMGSAVAVSLVGAGLMAAPVAAQDDCVVISGGEVFNETVIDLNANAGTAIADASGGFGNLATTGGFDNDDGLDIASAGNAGVATASASGGVIGVGDINSGGNVGNAISVGDTICAPFVPPAPDKPAPAPDKPAPAPDKPAPAPDAPRGGRDRVVALPATGVGIGDASALFALIASAGAAATSLGLRRR